MTCPATPSTLAGDPAHLAEPLAVLLAAYICTRRAARPGWDLAVQWPLLRAAGLSAAGLRRLVYLGYAEDAVERPGRRAGRSFCRNDSLNLGRQTHVVLTDVGAVFAVELAMQHRATALRDTRYAVLVQQLTPSWDSTQRELRLDPHVVKSFAQPAECQEIILAAFQEEGWPVHILDPLPPVPGMPPKRRLHGTLNNLNRGQQVPFVQFHGDGTGTGICWRVSFA